MNDKIELLNHGFVRLIDSMGNDLSVSRSARVSYDAAWRAGEDEGSDHKLIHYLYKNKHMTPFESVTFTFEVKAPIFVFRQWHRHRTFSYNELSGRYKELPEEYYLPEAHLIGGQAKKNKQGRELIDNAHLIRRREVELVLAKNTIEYAFKTYRELLEDGWPRELARSVLPTATYSHMFCTVNLRNLLAFFDLRDDSHAQYEIRIYAQALKELARKIVPVSISAWEKVNGRVS